MTNHERAMYFESGQLQEAVQIELLDWAGYWTTAGLDEITDPLQKAQTAEAIRLILNDLQYMDKVVSELAISDSAIKEAPMGGVTESMIKSAVTSIMANKLAWITGITQVVPAA